MLDKKILVTKSQCKECALKLAKELTELQEHSFDSLESKIFFTTRCLEFSMLIEDIFKKFSRGGKN